MTKYLPKIRSCCKNTGITIIQPTVSMRNLTLSATTFTEFKNANVSATAIDVDENVIYATSEKLTPDGELEVEIWKIDKNGVR